MVVVFAISPGPPLKAQAAASRHPAPATPLWDGAELFRNHCASCHGIAGRGDGPMSPAMRKPPADLTKFAAMNGGVFPTERLRRIIDGRDVPSHGDRTMPVWGITLRTSRGEGGYDTVAARIHALVRYIQSIQERKGQ
jgi:mono/diheme cytochrome c family protein